MIPVAASAAALPGTPAVRRVVTGHDTAGRAVVVRDDAMQTTAVPTGDARFTLLWTSAASPADLADPADAAQRTVGLALPGGSVLRMVDIAPGCRSPMHRTRSLDYGIVLSGEIALELDDGATTILHAGDVIVQRGTIHAWVNATDRWCRIAFVLLDAAPVLVDGVPLDATH